MVVPNIPVWGNEQYDYWQNGQNITVGNVNSFGNNGDPPASTGRTGVFILNNGMAPAYWDIDWLEPWNCGTNTDPSLGPVYQGIQEWAGADWSLYNTSNSLLYNYYPSGLYYSLDCFLYGELSTASTRFAIAGSLPNTLTLGSQVPLTTQFGMPLLYVYDKNSNVAATETAENVSSDGTQATFPFPSTLTQNGYSLAILNQTGGTGGPVPADVNLLSIAGSQTIAGNPFGVAAGELTTTTNICTVIIIGGHPHQSCKVSSAERPIPIVSLYSQGQALIGNSRVAVGEDPTAVAVYPAAAESVTSTNTIGDTTTTVTSSTSMRAVVANSGANTLTILDILNGVPITNVTVGSHPVALVASPDGSTAFVANYGDNTVTQVNLSSGTVVTTVAVGGPPTSVALSSAGILWVGGQGFLSEINTQDMSVIATESTGNTITALAYSDGENELIATSANSGSMSIDELSPSTFQPGGAYAPLASHSVSTSFGTYYNPRLQTDVQGYTATVTTSIVPINTNLPGAPPLVVQDGWAVVTATPTGFTITDTSGHTVLVSETTPSPIAAIAVDSKLNVAYLTMPDSNTLLTVPLPGTGSN